MRAVREVRTKGQFVKQVEVYFSTTPLSFPHKLTVCLNISSHVYLVCHFPKLGASATEGNFRLQAYVGVTNKTLQFLV